MGRNLTDFYEDSPNHHSDWGNGKGASFYRPNVSSPSGEGAIVERRGKKLVATGDAANSEISRKVTRNRDVKKQGTRIAKVAVKMSKMQKKDKGFN